MQTDKDNLANYFNIFDGIWMARNKIAFEGKNLQVLEVIQIANKSYNDYKASINMENHEDQKVLRGLEHISNSKFYQHLKTINKEGQAKKR